MLGKSLRIFSLFGIPVYLHASFFIIVPLLAWFLSESVPIYAQWTTVEADVVELFQITRDPDTGAYDTGRPVAGFLFGVALTLGLYLSVLVHEFGHALTALPYGVKTERITLWFLGGLAGFKQMPRQKGAEAVVAIAGPITSLAVAGVCLALAIVSSGEATVWQLVVQSLVVVNVILAVFNMIPALPMDGGRVLRSLLALVLPFETATFASVVVSRVFAVLFVVVGLWQIDLMLAAIGVFIWMAGGAENRQAALESALKDVRVGDVMNRNVTAVPPMLPIGELVRQMMQTRIAAFPVLDEQGVVVGTIGVPELESEPPPDQTVASVMRTDLCRQSPSASMQDAINAMSQGNHDRCIVVDDAGRLLGLVSKTDLLHHLQVRQVINATPDEPSRTWTN